MNKPTTTTSTKGAMNPWTKEAGKDPEMQPTSYSYVVIRPGGNDTALVIGVIRDAATRKKINDQIMAAHPNVEQVGFVNLDLNDPELMMTGNEFCGNGTRATAHQVLAGQAGEILITVSGVANRLRAGVDEAGNAWAQMPIYAETNRISERANGRTVVEMEGITHVVMEDIYPEATPEELKQLAFSILRQEGLDSSMAAAGVLFLTRTESGIQMRPVVWVRDIGTLFYESACGSGTTAVGLLEAYKAGESINLPIIQPSGMPINIKVAFDGQTFAEAVISGPVEVLNQDGEGSL